MEILRAIKNSIAIPSNEFADLIELYSDKVYKFCRGLTYSGEDADDLFQETFLKAFEQQSKLRCSDNPQGFLFSTSLYIWKAWKRKHARRNRLAPAAQLNDTIASDTNTEDEYLKSQETQVVRELVQGLPDKFKISIILYYSIEMSVHDIAATLKIPVGTVKSRLFKARRLVEKGLYEYEKQ